MTQARKASVERTTRETTISVEINLDGRGEAAVDTGIGFFDHMLEQLARHSLIDITIKAAGDLHIDGHHTVEDCGLALGEAFAIALGERRGINRYASVCLPMDEALTRVAVDISGRPFLVWRAVMTAPSLGEMSSETVPEFFQAFSQAGRITLHVENLYGVNCHHITESIFKALARSLRHAVAVDPREGGRIPSTKGSLGGSP